VEEELFQCDDPQILGGPIFSPQAGALVSMGDLVLSWVKPEHCPYPLYR